ncbi:50S ribosomal protein L15-like [Salvia divinorum]
MKTLKDCGATGKQIEDGVRLMGRGAEHIKWLIHLELIHFYFSLSFLHLEYVFGIHLLAVSLASSYTGFTGDGKGESNSRARPGDGALLKPEWFEKKGRLLPKAARPPPKLKEKVDSVGRLPAPRKPIPFNCLMSYYYESMKVKRNAEL